MYINVQPVYRVNIKFFGARNAKVGVWLAFQSENKAWAMPIYLPVGILQEKTNSFCPYNFYRW